LNKGLGDKIEKFTEKTGIKKAIKMIFGDDCGCQERKEKLNSLFPNFKNIRPFTPDEKKVYENIIPKIEKTKKIMPDQQTALNILNKSIFNTTVKWTACGSCNKTTLENLRKIYEKSCE
jgi:hypothetical protein